ncbi:MAG: OmpA family protein [Bacteroidia bacterium]|nr:OmpA family protein [Bacteroidia bacterium]
MFPKKLLVFFITIIFTFTTKAEGIRLSYGCYSNNDTINLNVVKKNNYLNLLGDGAESFMITSWEMHIHFKKGKKIVKLKPSKNSTLITRQMKDELMRGWKKFSHVTIENIVINAINDASVTSSLPTITFYLNDKMFKTCDEKTVITQNSLEIKVSCFGNGDKATKEELLRYSSLTLTNYNSKVNTKLLSYNCVFSGKDPKKYPNGSITIANNDLALNIETLKQINKMNIGDVFTLKDITIEFSNSKTKSKEVTVVSDVGITIAEQGNRPCGERISQRIEYSGKLLTGLKGNIAVPNQKVALQNSKNEIVQVTVTNIYGDFTFTNLSIDEHYLVKVDIEDNSKIKDSKLFIARQDGTVVKSFVKNNNTFTYELIPTELTTLSREQEEDTEFKLRKFSYSNQTELTVIENIYFDFNSAEVKDESMRKLDKIIGVMKQNLELKLLIASHSDSKGDDAYNLNLSEKRASNVMDYFLKNGIDKIRLSAKGYGESQIMNRCKNGVECSETEHELNRRTEFKFKK